jgi:hypothetical protein
MTSGIAQTFDTTTGATPITDLMEERLKLAKSIAFLWARYGNNGTYKDIRDNLYGAIGLEKRLELDMKGKKYTEGLVDGMIRTDQRWERGLEEAETARADLFIQQTRLDNLEAKLVYETQLRKFATQAMKEFGG